VEKNSATGPDFGPISKALAGWFGGYSQGKETRRCELDTIIYIYWSRTVNFIKIPCIVYGHGLEGESPDGIGGSRDAIGAALPGLETFEEGRTSWRGLFGMQRKCLRVESKMGGTVVKTAKIGWAFHFIQYSPGIRKPGIMFD